MTIDQLLTLTPHGMKKTPVNEIDEFLEYIPEAQDIIRHTANFIMHRQPIIERVKSPFDTDNNLSTKENKELQKDIEKEYEIIKEYRDNPDNQKAHLSTLMSYLTYAVATTEVTGDRMYPVDIHTSELTYNDKLYKKSGIIEINGFSYSAGLGNTDIPFDKGFVYSSPSASANPYGDPRFKYKSVLFEIVKRTMQKNGAILDNAIHSNFYLEYQPNTPIAEIQKNANLMLAMSAGYMNSHSPFHVPGGAKLNQFKPDDSLTNLSYMDLLKVALDVVRTAFNFPSSQNSNSSATGPDYRLFVQGTVNPEKKLYEGFLNYYVIQKILKLKHWRIKIPEMQVGTALEIAQAGEIYLSKGVVTINQLREISDFSIIDATKEGMEFADKHLRMTDRFTQDLSLIGQQTTSLDENGKEITVDPSMTMIDESKDDPTVQPTTAAENLENNPNST